MPDDEFLPGAVRTPPGGGGAGPAGTFTWRLPEPLAAHARRWLVEGGVPATPRVAATVVLLRPESRPGLEAYVIRRAASMTFASGMYAFPGGGVDARDADESLALIGPGPAEWATRLRLPEGEAQAVVCAAAREVFEESGVLLAGPLDDPVALVDADLSGPDWESARRALVARDIGFAHLLRERGLALRADLLLPWARWITPEFEPRRYDTYFFVAMLPSGQHARDVSGEADHTMWSTPAEMLRRHAAGEVAMLPPTEVTLRSLAGYARMADVVVAAAGRDAATPVTPRLREDPGGAILLIDRDPPSGAGDVSRSGR